MAKTSSWPQVNNSTVANILTFTEATFYDICDQLALADPDLQHIITAYGYPPFWNRPNSYETLVHVILEQQVSLASAKAALEKLRAKIGDITPENVIVLSDEELKAAYVSRQKISYIRYLSRQLLDGTLVLSDLAALPDDEVRSQLIQLKGIGNWTIDIYLIMVLHRSDVLPLGDLAIVNAFKRLKSLPKDTTSDRLLDIAAEWQPNRTIATMLLWHYYLSSRSK